MSEDDLPHEIRRRFADGNDRIADRRIRRVGPGRHAAAVSRVSEQPEPPRSYKARHVGLAGPGHLTVEVQSCPGAH